MCELHSPYFGIIKISTTVFFCMGLVDHRQLNLIFQSCARRMDPILLSLVHAQKSTCQSDQSKGFLWLLSPAAWEIMRWLRGDAWTAPSTLQISTYGTYMHSFYSVQLFCSSKGQFQIGRKFDIMHSFLQSNLNFIFLSENT